MTILSPPGVTLRLATTADSHCLSALATQVFLDTYATEGIRPWLAREVHEHLSPSAVETLLATPSSTFVVAQRSEHLIAFAQLTEGSSHSLVTCKRPAELGRLYVQSPFLGKGIGKFILQHAEALAASRGTSTLWLTAWVGNIRALGFYSRQGYEDHGSSDYTFEEESFENRVLAKNLPQRVES